VFAAIGPESLLVALMLVVAFAYPQLASNCFGRAERALGALARRRKTSVLVCGRAANRILASLCCWSIPNSRPAVMLRRRKTRWTNIQIPGLVPVLLIVAIWVLVAFLINPRGEFPLNDDWAYARSVESLLGGGGLKFPEISTNIIAQIFWGALFCLPFGFSFTALRISTLTLGVIGVVALYGLLLEVDADRKTALFGALLLAFNPLYLVLSYSFMSDVPFTAISLLSLYFIVRGMRRNSQIEVSAGLFLACIALLIRQNGLAVFMAVGLTYISRKGLRLRSTFLASIPLALGVSVQVLWDQWMKYSRILPAHHSMQASWVLSPLSYVSWQATVMIVYGLVVISWYLGLFLFPLMLFVGRRRLAELCPSRLLNWTTLVFATLILLLARRWPLIGNVLCDTGLGPVTLHDVYLLRLPSLPTAGNALLFLITCLGTAGAVVLVQATSFAVPAALKFRPFPPGKRDPLVLLLASGLINLVPIAILTIRGWIIDRYLLFLLPLGIAIVLLLVSEVRGGKAGSAIMRLAMASLVLYGAFSIAGTHDYLSWNRARWEALNNLMTEQRVSADDIDGGYEFNGWHLRDSKYRSIREKIYWWLAAGDDFMVTFGPVPGFTELRRYPFRRWLPPAEGHILVLGKTTKDQAKPAPPNGPIDRN
jgi:hypothetical protein